MDRDELIATLAEAMAGWSPELRQRLASGCATTRTDARYIAAAIIADKMPGTTERAPARCQPSLFPAHGRA